MTAFFITAVLANFLYDVSIVCVIVFTKDDFDVRCMDVSCVLQNDADWDGQSTSLDVDGGMMISLISGLVLAIGG